VVESCARVIPLFTLNWLFAHSRFYSLLPLPGGAVQRGDHAGRSAARGEGDGGAEPGQDLQHLAPGLQPAHSRRSRPKRPRRALRGTRIWRRGCREEEELRDKTEDEKRVI